ncbi:ferritin-like domain-containing protein [Brachybacterium squillarum]|uniref:ferritin-like domain-containing protein n=1 Tax=Brachybacterium squillarum TaxID=661979 RepID=UPI002222BAB1|nr:ferritin-like domain-containing protein [Brachybacterium squillarum]MCW1805201.1 ferritin-like domain-containing protein [Brachybacterium squillarum]
MPHLLPDPRDPGRRDPSAHRRPAPRPGRRAVLVAGASTGLLALAGCGTVRLGGPAPYTPPPPGIDDLYREDLLASLETCLAGARAVAEATDPGTDAATAEVLSELVGVLPAQRDSLRTGAELEDAASAEAAGSPTATVSPSASPAADAAALVAALSDLRVLCTAAARQVSGSLARPVAAIGAHVHWAALRLAAASGAGEVAALPATEEIVPTRTVPETDPPSIGAESDYHLTIEAAQDQEWYAGYVHEVLAARTADEERTAHEEASTLHRDRAATLAAAAEEDGAPVVERKAVYVLPVEPLDDDTAAKLPAQVAVALLDAHLALTGAAPFARRPLGIAAALAEAGVLAPLTGAMDPLPSLDITQRGADG